MANMTSMTHQDITGKITLSETEFTSLYRFMGNGVAIIISNTGDLTLTQSIFSQNSTGWGTAGAIYSEGILTISDDVVFSGNSADYAGAIFTGGTTTISQGRFEQNISNDNGGAMKSIGTLSVTGTDFIQNRSGLGGVLYNDIGGKATFNYCFFSGNTATGDGGVFENYAQLTITGGTFSGNLAAIGGAIDNCESGKVTMNDVIFYGNSASSNGGAIYSVGSENHIEGSNKNAVISVSGGSFTANSAAKGGAIFNAGLCNATLANAVFTGNSASVGGAIYNRGTLTLSGGNAFSTSTDTIYNESTLNVSGANTLGGNLINASNGTINFNNAATTTITNAAKLINGNTTASQSLKGKVLVHYDSVVGATAADTSLKVEFTEGSWNYGTVKAGTTAANAVSLGNSFTNDNGTKLWFGSYNGKTGITDNTLEVNAATITNLNEDFSRFNTLAHLNSTYTDFDGIINVTGGSYSENIYGNMADLLFDTAASTATGKLIVGGHADSTTIGDSTVTVNSVLTAGSVIGGDQYKIAASLTGNVTFSGDRTLSITSASNLIQFAVAGNLLNTNTSSANTYTFTDSSAKTLSIGGGASSRIVVGGSIVGKKIKLTDSGDSLVTISGGSYTFVDGAGYIQNDGTAVLAKSGTTTINVTGGTCDYIYGGVGGNSYTYVARATVSGAVAINVTASSASAVTVGSIFGGCSGKTTGFSADTTIAFSGDGSYLTFASASGLVAGGNVRTGAPESKTSGTSGVNTLAFNGFSGAFNAPKVRDFDTATFTNSTMSFACALNLTDVETWNFDGSSQLTWNDGKNDFAGDTLNFTGFSSGTKTVIASDGVDLFTNLSTAQAVNINNAVAAWQDDKWVASTGNLSVSGNSLIVTIA